MSEHSAERGAPLCDAHPRGQARPVCDLDAGHAGDHYSITDDARWPAERPTPPAREGQGLLIPSHWNPHWNYRLGGEPRSICACPDGPYEGARLATIPRYCERCGGLVSVTSPEVTRP